MTFYKKTSYSLSLLLSIFICFSSKAELHDLCPTPAIMLELLNTEGKMEKFLHRNEKKVDPYTGVVEPLLTYKGKVYDMIEMRSYKGGYPKKAIHITEAGNRSWNR